MAKYKAGTRNAAGLFIVDALDDGDYVLESPECNKLFIAHSKAVKRIERCRDCATRRHRLQVKENQQQARTEERQTLPTRTPSEKRKAFQSLSTEARHEDDIFIFLDPKRMWERMRKQERENKEAENERRSRITELALCRKRS